jgi:hypothetical protein
MLPTIYGGYKRAFESNLRGYEKSPQKSFGRISPRENSKERLSETGVPIFANGKEKSVFEQSKIPYPRKEIDCFQAG